jgi:hypothetical protein
MTRVGYRTRIFANLQNKEGSCPLNGKRTFAEAVTAIVASKELAQKIIAINVSQEMTVTEIAYRHPSKTRRSTSASKFGLAGQHEEPGLTLRATLNGSALNRMVEIFAFDKGDAHP